MSQSEAPELLTTDEVAQVLRIPRKQVYGLIRDEGLPALKLSAGRFRIPRADLDMWLAARRAMPVESPKRS